MPGDLEECPLPLEGGGGVATVAVDRFLVGLKALRFQRMGSRQCGQVAPGPVFIFYVLC